MSTQTMRELESGEYLGIEWIILDRFGTVYGYLRLPKVDERILIKYKLHQSEYYEDSMLIDHGIECFSFDETKQHLFSAIEEIVAATYSIDSTKYKQFEKMFKEL